MMSSVMRLLHFLIPVICILESLLLFSILMLSVGFISDDFELLQKPYYALHFAPLINFFWEKTAEGVIGSTGWHSTALFFHLINGTLSYYFVRKVLKLSSLISISATAFVLMNPLGLEAVVWACCLGYVITLSWILLALCTFENRFGGWIVALLQLLAIFTWDWGGLLFPAVAVFAWGQKNISKKLIPAALIWTAFVFFRIFSEHQIVYHDNTLVNMVIHFFGSPVVGLFPGIPKSDFLSWPGFAIACIFYAVVCSQYKNRLFLSLVFIFFGSVLPWALFGFLGGRYFYISLPFLYFAILVLLAKYERANFLSLALPVLLIMQFIWMNERGFLWLQAYDQAQKVKNQIEEVAGNTPFVVMNIPEAFGPSNMTMRPQMWCNGLSVLFPNLIQVRTKNSPNVCSAGKKIDKLNVEKLYPNIPIYEMINSELLKYPNEQRNNTRRQETDNETEAR